MKKFFKKMGRGGVYYRDMKDLLQSHPDALYGKPTPERIFYQWSNFSLTRLIL
jgi:hypothetical protein